MSNGIQKSKIKPAIRTFLLILAVAALLLTLVPSILHWQGVIGPGQVNNLMLAGSILWFATAGFLFWERKP